MNCFRTQDTVLEPKNIDFFCGGKMGGGIKISVGKREGIKNFFWWGRGCKLGLGCVGRWEGG